MGDPARPVSIYDPDLSISVGYNNTYLLLFIRITNPCTFRYANHTKTKSEDISFAFSENTPANTNNKSAKVKPRSILRGSPFSS